MPSLLLCASDGLKVTQAFLTAGETLGVGRAAENRLRLAHPEVSRFHAVVRWTGAELVVSDLSSANGTRVGSDLLSAHAPTRVALGQPISIGPYRITADLAQEDDTPLERPRTPFPRAATAATLRSMLRPSRPSLAPGVRLGGQYLIRAMLGAGGMGEVYEADDLRLQRRVAVKIPFEGRSYEAFEREAQALAALRHPNVVEVFGLGTDDDRPFLVMERIVGSTLAQHLSARTELPLLDAALDVLAPLSDALSALHAAGLVHRDVKPSNVLLGLRGRVVLADFGLSSTVGDAPERGRLRGTPAYMAPEVICAEAEPGLATHVDVYAFGVLAFELLVGRLPFDEGSFGELVRMHVSRVPPALVDVRPSVDPRLSALVAEMLAKDPALRPSMDEVRHRLAALRLGPRSRVVVADPDRASRAVLVRAVRDELPHCDLTILAEGVDLAAELDRDAADLVVVDVALLAATGVTRQKRRGKLSVDRLLVTSPRSAVDCTVLRRLGVRCVSTDAGAAQLRDALGAWVSTAPA